MSDHCCALDRATFHYGVGHVVTGWVQLPWDTQTFRIALLTGQRPLRGSFRFSARTDLDSPLGARRFGFEFQVEQKDAAHLAQEPVTLVLGSDRGGARCEKRLQPPRWAWAIETLNDYMVTGWAIDMLMAEAPAVLLLRAKGMLVTATTSLPRPDVVLSPEISALGFAVDLRELTVTGNSGGVRRCGWIEFCVGDVLNPVATLRLPQSVGRPSAIGQSLRRRMAALRATEKSLIAAQAKCDSIDCAPLTKLGNGFEAALRAPSLVAEGFELQRQQTKSGQVIAVWQNTSGGTETGLAVVCAPGLVISPSLAVLARRILAVGLVDAWYVPNGIRECSAGAQPQLAADPSASSADAGSDMAFPLLKPQLTLRLLAQSPEYAPLLLVPPGALASWRAEDGWWSLLNTIFDRIGPPSPCHDVLYAAPGSPSVYPTALSSSYKDALVSFVVPTRDNVANLAKLIASLAWLRKRYPSLEVLIVDNNSHLDTTNAFLNWISSDWIKVIRDDGDFNFSRLSNLGARSARGDLLVFCNDDIEIGPDFHLAAMTSLFDNTQVGIAGHTLIYEDGTIQHGGVVVGAYGAAANGQTAFTISQGGYFGLAALTREVSAVTGAFLVIRRSIFEEVSGFNEIDFAVNFNDIDLCLRVQKLGYTVLNTCCGTIVHAESASRSKTVDRLDREVAEVRVLRRVWQTERYADPYYSPGFDRQALPYTRPHWLQIGLPRVVGRFA